MENKGRRRETRAKYLKDEAMSGGCKKMIEEGERVGERKGGKD